MSLIEQLKYQFNTGGTYLKIIYINVGVFIVFLLLNVFAALMKASNMIDIVPLFDLEFISLHIFYSDHGLYYIHVCSPFHRSFIFGI